MKNQYDYLNDATVDFSAYEIESLDEKELTAMKNLIRTPKKKILARLGAIAACVGLVAALSQTAFAKELIDNIVKSISTGRNEFFQYDMTNAEVELPEKLQIFYDENGELVTTYHDGQVFYDKDGNEITDMAGYMKEAGVVEAEIDENGTKLSVAFGDKVNGVDLYRKNGYAIAESEEEIAALGSKLDFEPLFPEKLPKGFELRAAAYFDTSRYYLTLIYMNDEGKDIVVSERLINDETAFAMGTDDEIEEIEINGHKAVLSGGRNLDWEAGGVAIGISTKGNAGRDELIAMGESVK